MIFLNASLRHADKNKKQKINKKKNPTIYEKVSACPLALKIPSTMSCRRQEVDIEKKLGT